VIEKSYSVRKKKFKTRREFRGQNFEANHNYVRFFNFRVLKKGIGCNAFFFKGRSNSWEDVKKMRPEKREAYSSAMKMVQAVLKSDWENNLLDFVREIVVCPEIAAELYFDGILTKLASADEKKPNEIRFPNVIPHYINGLPHYDLVVVPDQCKDFAIGTRDAAGKFL
jgi:antitoxin component HigA of HigAB toxin-antitoxin module